MRPILTIILLAISLQMHSQTTIDHVQGRLYPFDKRMDTPEKSYKAAGNECSDHRIFCDKSSFFYLRQDVLFQLFDSISSANLLVSENEWIPEERMVNFLYDNQNRLKSFDIQRAVANQWVNHMRVTYLGDVYGNLIEYKEFSWENQNWEPAYFKQYTYQTGNYLSHLIDFRWEDNQWLAKQQSNYEYFTNGQLKSELIQNMTDQVWTNSMQVNYSYNNQFDLVSVVFLLWDDEWVNHRQINMTYQELNLLLTETEQIWDGSAWGNYLQYSYTYQPNQLMQQFKVKYWSENYWNDWGLSKLFYDASNNLIREMQQLWDGSAWVNLWQANYTYDQNHFMTSETNKSYDIYGVGVSGGYKVSYYFRTIAGLGQTEKATVRVYPNPAKDQLIVSLDAPIATIELVSTSGAIVLTSAQKNSLSPVKMNLSGIGHGLYLVRISATNGEVYAKRILIP